MAWGGQRRSRPRGEVPSVEPAPPEAVCPLCGDPTPLLSVNAAAELAGVSRKTIYRWIRSEILQHCTLPSGTIRIFPHSLIRTSRGRRRSRGVGPRPESTH